MDGQLPPREPPSGMSLSREERCMWDTITWLLSLPAEERACMELAEQVGYGDKALKAATAPPRPLAPPAPLAAGAVPAHVGGPPPPPRAAAARVRQTKTTKKWADPVEKAAAHNRALHNLAPPYQASVAAGIIKSFPGETLCAVLDTGTVEAAALLCSLGLCPAVLNFAHGYNCGGGFEHAAGSQEEDLFRKTSLFLSLWPHRRADDGAGVLQRGLWIGEFDECLPRKEPYYPHTKAGAIYSPHVRLLRPGGGKRSGASALPPTAAEGSGAGAAAAAADAASTSVGAGAAAVEALPVVAVLTVAAQNVGREPPFQRELLLQKARTTLYLAALHGHSALVLGAFGCGYFRNPAREVAAVFDELLRGEFRGAFAAVCMAVPTAYGRHNFEAFSERFEVLPKEKFVAQLRATLCATAQPEPGR